MKLLSDENVSFRLVPALADLYPGSAHVRDFGLLGAEDRAIWSDAAESCSRPRTRTSMSEAFCTALRPKVIWLRIGKRPVADTAGILRGQYIRIRRFHENPQAAFLPVRPT